MRIIQICNDDLLQCWQFGLLFRFGTTHICFSKFFAKPNGHTSWLLARSISLAFEKWSDDRCFWSCRLLLFTKLCRRSAAVEFLRLMLSRLSTQRLRSISGLFNSVSSSVSFSAYSVAVQTSKSFVVKATNSGRRHQWYLQSSMHGSIRKTCPDLLFRIVSEPLLSTMLFANVELSDEHVLYPCSNQSQPKKKKGR